MSLDSHPLGMRIFNDIDIPQAQDDKNIFCILVHNISDGIGDFAHATDFAKRLLPRLHEKGYRLYLLVESELNPNFPDTNSGNKRAKLISDILADNKVPCDEYLLLEIGKDNLEEWKLHHRDMLGSIYSQTAGAIGVSYPSTYLDKMLPDRINLIHCDQYASNTASSVPTLKSATMGVMDPRSPVSYGIKIYSQNETSKEKNMERLQEGEPLFVNALLNGQSIERYQETHHFMPAYLQSKSAACAFILTQVLRWKDDGKIIDFHIPVNVVAHDLIIELLAKAGIQEDEIAFGLNASNINSPNTKVRILFERIENDENYNLLYSISDGGGGSGDNSVSLACSTDKIPWFEIKNPSQNGGYSKFCKYFPDYIASQNRGLSEDLIENIALLKKYFEYLIQFRHLSTDFDFDDFAPFTRKLLDEEKEMLPTDESPENWEKIRATIQSDEFYKYCMYGAQLLRNESGIHTAWEFIAQRLKDNNYYDQLENIAKATILTSSEPHATLYECIANSKEIRELEPDKLMQIMRTMPSIWKHIKNPDFMIGHKRVFECLKFSQSLANPKELDEITKIINKVEKYKRKSILNQLSQQASSSGEKIKVNKSSPKRPKP